MSPQKLDPRSKVKVGSVVVLKVKADGLDGKTACFAPTVEGQTYPEIPPEANQPPPPKVQGVVGSLELGSPKQAPVTGGEAVLPWTVDCDPQAGTKPFPTYVAPQHTMNPTHPIQAAVAVQFNVCAENLVKRHRLFYWWSDHAHFHAVDVAKNMTNWLKYFCAPHVPGGVDYEEPGFALWKQLAPWAGYLHDLGMGANDRLVNAIEELDRIDSEADFERHDALCRDALGEKGIKRMLEPRLNAAKGLLALLSARRVADAEKVYIRALRSIAKERLASWHKESIRKRHSVNSALYCVGKANECARTLREHFTDYQLQRLGLIVCTHSKSAYGEFGIEPKHIAAAAVHIHENCEKLKAPNDVSAVAGPGHDAWGPWLAEKLEFKFNASIDGAFGSPKESPPIEASERRYLDAVLPLMGIADAMRERGNMGGFKDNQGVSFKRLPLDETQRKLLHAGTPPKGKTGIECASFRVTAQVDAAGFQAGTDPRTKTYLELLRFLNERHDGLKGLFGDPADPTTLGRRDPNAELKAVVEQAAKDVNPSWTWMDLLTAIGAHPDNDVLVEIGEWKFNLGELGEGAMGPRAASEMDPPIPLAMDPNKVVFHLPVETDCDRNSVAAMLIDNVLEGPRTFGRGWIMAIDKDPLSETSVPDWMLQHEFADLGAKLDEYKTKYGALTFLREGNGWVAWETVKARPKP